MSIKSLTYQSHHFDQMHSGMLDRVPLITQPLHDLLTALHPQSHPPASLVSLPEKIKELTHVNKILKNAESRYVKDKILSLLITALFLGLIAATALSFCIHPLLGAALLVATVTYLALCNMQALAKGQKEERLAQNHLSLYPLGILFGPFTLSYMLFTRRSSLQKSQATLEDQVQKHTSITISFWSKHAETLFKRILQEQTNAELSFKTMRKLPVRSNQGEQEIAEYRQLLDQARIAIEKGKQLLPKCG